jgi:hypothetical protein
MVAGENVDLVIETAAAPAAGAVGQPAPDRALVITA